MPLSNIRTLIDQLRVANISIFRQQEQNKNTTSLVLQKYITYTLPSDSCPQILKSLLEHQKSQRLKKQKSDAASDSTATSSSFEHPDIELTPASNVDSNQTSTPRQIILKLRLTMSYGVDSTKDITIQAEEIKSLFTALQLDKQKISSNMNQIFSTLQTIHDLTLASNEKITNAFEDPDFSTLAVDILKDFSTPSRQTTNYSKHFATVLNNKKKILSEKLKISELEEKLQFSNYQNTFLGARALKRKIKIFLGPTNSGKTYSAFEELKKYSSGLYLAPLRLLAHEGVDKLTERAILANLMTGEERREVAGATHTCSTVEMCDLNRHWPVAVIDEIQMLNDSQRGWAWTQAIVGLKADNLILVGSEEIMPKLMPLLKELSDSVEIVKFERKNPLKVTNSLSSDTSRLKTGDALIVFSRKDALYYKKLLADEGKNCSVVYGNLSPEVRVQEAKRFNNEKTDIIIATDAIGMGLNLPVKRVVFSKVEKFDGIQVDMVPASLVKQIAGRAGRYSLTSEPGEVTTLHDKDLDYVKSCVNSHYPTDYEDKRLFIQPNYSHIQEICSSIGSKNITAALIFFKDKMVSNKKLFKPSVLDDMIQIAYQIDKIGFSDLRKAYTYCCAPIDINHEANFENFLGWLRLSNDYKTVPCPPSPSWCEKNTPANDFRLFEAENYVKLANVYRWLHWHDKEIFSEINEANERLAVVSSYIEKTLMSQNSKIGEKKKRKKF